MVVVPVARRLRRRHVHVVLDAGMTLDFERRVINTEAIMQHLLQLDGTELSIVQRERFAKHDVR